MKKFAVLVKDQVYILLITLIVVNFLFYIDEGYYDFRWIRNAGNWVAFAIYFVVLFGVQFGVLLFVHRFGGKVIIPVVCAVGVTIGLTFLFYWLG